jgi:dihydroorotate dehydrogenase electron transfer subunit
VASFPDRAALAIDGLEVIDASDDGSCGFSGTSVACLADLLDGAPGGEGHVFGAGPVPMLRGLVELARERGLDCQVSLEARMACGVGVCRGCVVNAVEPHPKTGLRRRAVCKDGPVFDADELDWERLQ